MSPFDSDIDFTSTRGLREAGFQGFSTFEELRADGYSAVPEKPGVYIVLMETRAKPVFLEVGTGGWFKGNDPNVPVADLEEKWVPGAIVLYIGKAAILRRRITQYIKFGSGKRVAHRGGRYVWQIEGSDRLILCWKPTPDEEPREVETALISSFEGSYRGLPFANLQR